MTAHLKRIEVLETDLKNLRQLSAVKSDIDGARAEYKQLINFVSLDVLDLKAHVWGVESDLNSLSKSAGSRV